MTGICLSGGVYSDSFWRRLDGDPDFPTLIRNGKLRHIRMIAAAQDEQARQHVMEVGNQVHVHWRHMLHVPPGGSHKTDDGMWQLPVGEWRQNVYFAHGYQNMPMSVSDNNEFSTSDLEVLKRYIDSRIRLIQIAYIWDMRLDMLSFPTHWPRYSPGSESWLADGHFDPLFQAIAEHQGSDENPRLYCLPNGYVNPDNLDGLRNIKAIYRRFKDVTAKAPHMVVGEYGYAMLKDGKFDPHGGHKADPNMSARQSIKFGIEQYDAHLRALGIDVMWYTAGLLGGNEVTSFHYTMPELAYFASLTANLKAPEKLPDTAPLPTEPRPPVVPEPEPPVDVPEPPKTGPNTRHYALERHVNSMRLLVETHHARRKILQAEMDALDAQAQMLQVELLLAEDALEQWTEAAHAA